MPDWKISWVHLITLNSVLILRASSNKILNAVYFKNIITQQEFFYLNNKLIYSGYFNKNLAGLINNLKYFFLFL